MKSLKEQFIGYVVGEAVKRAPLGHTPRIMDLGCGTASYVPSLMEKFPNFEYVGVEPIAESFAAVKKISLMCLMQRFTFNWAMNQFQMRLRVPSI